MKTRNQSVFLKNLWIAAFAAGIIMGAVNLGHAGTDGTAGGTHKVEAMRGNPSPGQRKSSGQVWHGATQAEWTQRFWQWYMTIPLGVGPANDATGAQCAINQSGPVWFIGAPLGSTFTRSCTIPKGKAILAPIINFINDYPCPDPTFQPAPNQTLEDFLIAGTTPIIDGVTVHVAELDGRALPDQRITAGLFSFTGAADLAPSFDPCVTGSPQLGVTDGYFLFIDPPSVGQHTLHIQSELPSWGLSTDGTFILTITK